MSTSTSIDTQLPNMTGDRCAGQSTSSPVLNHPRAEPFRTTQNAQVSSRNLGESGAVLRLPGTLTLRGRL